MSIPIIKWAGGKRQLLSELKQRIPKEYNRYYEPFFGSGALFFDVQPKDAIINDFNKELINMYSFVCNEPDGVIGVLDELQNEYNALDSLEDKSECFYRMRERYNEGIVNGVLNKESAALFIFLNKSCYNGLYRVNSKGLFNTPFGKHKKIKLYDKSNFKACVKALGNATIKYGDFEDACEKASYGDFVYFDSPYYDTFDTYQSGGFAVEEHIRLATLFTNLTEKGVLCMLSNSDTDFIKDLYKDYKIDVVEVKRMINCNGQNRTGTEIIVTNY